MFYRVMGVRERVYREGREREIRVSSKKCVNKFNKNLTIAHLYFQNDRKLLVPPMKTDQCRDGRVEGNSVKTIRIS